MRQLVGGILGGFVAGGLVLVAASIAFFDGIKSFDWCPDNRWQVGWRAALIGGVGGSFVGIFVGWLRLRRHEGLRRLAYTESAEFTEKAGDRLVEQVKTLLANPGAASLRDVMKQVDADRHTSSWVGDLSEDDEGENRKVNRRTIAVFHRPGLSIPQFILQPKRWALEIGAALIGLEEVRFADHASFTEAYHLSSSVQPLAMQLFDEVILDHFGARAGFEIGGDGDWLVVAGPQRKHLSAEARKRFSGQAREILALFVAASRDVDATVMQDATSSPAIGLRKLLPAEVTDDDIARFLSEAVPRSVPTQIARPHLVGPFASAIFGAFLLAPSCLSIPFLFLFPFKVALLVAIVPLVLGGVSLWNAWRLRTKRLRLLSHGQVVPGRVQSVTRATAQPSTTRYRVEVCYEAKGMPTTGFTNVSGEIMDEVWEAQEQDRTVQLIFDPQIPQHCLLTRQLSTSWRGHPSTRKASGSAED
ncbi:MAG: DUF3592 domain-containing protein [Planctomycetota bacterium]|nr:DUF3592 domain-containing protein [Planctomycetota bacterium]